MTRLTSGVAMDAAHLPVPYEPVDLAKVVSGSPFTRYLDLDDGSGRTIGVWEHTPGVSRDVEADEVFVVLAGDARIEFDEPALPPIELRPGSVVRLEEGMKTVWTVRETLRKVYIAP
ncbi:cupin domain-containing protein [Microbacterium aoyamense]|uniref:Cupin domain-containing protein n=1 Tax=Microbacterium aoyamense TaxID=344166 RepID=A0ABP5B476_9MICO|nr:cupin domain-containing protein [Microbacterium aoyamense]